MSTSASAGDLTPINRKLADEMLSDKATIQWLNLVHMSPRFVIRIGNAKERPVVQSPKVVPKNDGEY